MAPAMIHPAPIRIRKIPNTFFNFKLFIKEINKEESREAKSKDYNFAAIIFYPINKGRITPPRQPEPQLRVL